MSTRLPGNSAPRLIALLGGFCFFLSLLEYLVPKPLPFIRLGLANAPLLLALDILPFPSFVVLLGLKVIGQGLISGTLFSYVFVFSLGGAGVSGLLMYAMRRGFGKERLSLIGTSAAGALASNGVQLLLARFFVFGEAVRYAAVPILSLGIVTGTLLGIGAELFTRRSRWYAGALAGTEEAGPEAVPGAADRTSPGAGVSAGAAGEGSFERFRKAREAFCLEHFASAELALAGLCMMPALLFNPGTGGRVLQLFFFIALAWLSGKKNNLFITLLVMAGIVFFNLLIPYGELLVSLGPLRVTSGALSGGIRRAVTMEGLFMLSRCSVRRDLRFPGKFGRILGEAFRVFSVLAEGKRLFSLRDWAGQLDRLLFSIEGGTADGGNGPGSARNDNPEPGGTARARLRGRIILAALVVLAWLPWMLGTL